MAKQAILMFHGVGETPKNIPDAEVPYWINEQFFDDILRYVATRRTGPEVVFTFDDGNSTDVGAARKLATAGIKGHFYVLAGRLETPGYLGHADLRELDKLGMEVGLHGTDHVDWRHVSAERLRDETVTSREVLATAIGKPITSVAIPFGAYNGSVLRHLESQNFERIYLADNGLAKAGSKYLRRNPVLNWLSIKDIDNYVEDRASVFKKVTRTVMPLIKSRLL